MVPASGRCGKSGMSPTRGLYLTMVPASTRCGKSGMSLTQGLFIVSRCSSRSENPGAPARHSRRNGNPEPLLCVMKVVLRETC